MLACRRFPSPVHPLLRPYQTNVSIAITPAAPPLPLSSSHSLRGSMDGPGAWPIGGSRHALAYRSLDRDDSLSETVSLQRNRKRRQQARCPILRSSYFSVNHTLTASSKKVKIGKQSYRERESPDV